MKPRRLACLALVFWALAAGGASVADAADRPDFGEKALVSSVVHLYFANRRFSHLTSEMRKIAHLPDPAYLGKKIVQALIKGPKRDLLPTLPEQLEMTAFFTDNQTAYVVLKKAALEQLTAGCQAEALAVYSLVNSLVLNIPEIRSVQILLDGETADSFAGHFDIQFPLNANMLMVR